MASHRVKAQYKSIDVYSSMSKDGKRKKNNRAILHQAKEQRLQKDNYPISDMDASRVDKGQTLEEDGFVTTDIMRVVLSGMQKDKKKGQRILSFVALAGAFIVVGIYLVIPIMICLRITDTILAILVAALILTLIEGIVGIILVRIGTSRELKHSQKGRGSSHSSASIQQSIAPALIPMPMPTLPQPRLSRYPAFLPAAPAVRVSGQNRVDMAGRQPMPVTDPLRLADVAQVETIQLNDSRAAVVPPLLKLPASS